LVSGVGGERAVHAGEVLAYEPGETHGVRAITEELVLLAIIAPRPSSRHTSPETSATREPGVPPFSEHSAACSRRVDAELL
jgi:hypothetical protein